MARYGMVVDLKRCIGCGACIVACKSEHGTLPGKFWCRVLWEEVGKFPNVELTFYPINCMHCKEAACVKVCPTGATTKRIDGIVTIDSDKCVGCRYCIIACPFEARIFNEKMEGYFPKELTPYEKRLYKDHQVGVVEKCDFCLNLVEKGLNPSCVTGCPTGARYFGDLEDPKSDVSRLIRERRGKQLRRELATDPSIYYLPP